MTPSSKAIAKVKKANKLLKNSKTFYDFTEPLALYHGAIVLDPDWDIASYNYALLANWKDLSK